MDLPVSRDSSESSNGVPRGHAAVGGGGAAATMPIITSSSYRSTVKIHGGDMAETTFITPLGSEVPAATVATATIETCKGTGPGATYPYVWWSKPKEPLSGTSYSLDASIPLSTRIRATDSHGTLHPHYFPGRITTGPSTSAERGESGRLSMFASPSGLSPPSAASSSRSYIASSRKLFSHRAGSSPSCFISQEFLGQKTSLEGGGLRRETSPISSVPQGLSGSSFISGSGFHGRGSFVPSYGTGERRESVGSLKLPSYSLTHQSVQLPVKKQTGRDIIERTQCFYCKKWFRTDDNMAGACPDAPDLCDLWLQRLTCVWCAQEVVNCSVYCCWRDDDEFPLHGIRHTCSCDTVNARCCARWTILGFLSLFLPCLWCYPPLKACQLCCRSCLTCGGRHRAIRF